MLGLCPNRADFRASKPVNPCKACLCPSQLLLVLFKKSLIGTLFVVHDSSITHAAQICSQRQLQLPSVSSMMLASMLGPETLKHVGEGGATVCFAWMLS